MYIEARQYRGDRHTSPGEAMRDRRGRHASAHGEKLVWGRLARARVGRPVKRAYGEGRRGEDPRSIHVCYVCASR